MLEALACDGPAIEIMHEAASARSGTERVDAAAGLIRVSGSAWRVNVDAKVKLREAAIREVTEIRTL